MSKGLAAITAATIAASGMVSAGIAHAATTVYPITTPAPTLVADDGTGAVGAFRSEGGTVTFELTRISSSVAASSLHLETDLGAIDSFCGDGVVGPTGADDTIGVCTGSLTQIDAQSGLPPVRAVAVDDATGERVESALFAVPAIVVPHQPVMVESMTYPGRSVGHSGTAIEITLTWRADAWGSQASAGLAIKDLAIAGMAGMAPVTPADATVTPDRPAVWRAFVTATVAGGIIPATHLVLTGTAADGMGSSLPWMAYQTIGSFVPDACGGTPDTCLPDPAPPVKVVKRAPAAHPIKTSVKLAG